MSAARRAAAYFGLAAEPELSALAADASALDAFCALGSAVERAGVSDAALAIACADDSRSIAAVARVLLRARATLRAAAQGETDTIAEAPHAGAKRSSTCFDDVDAALAAAVAAGTSRMEAPRLFVDALGAEQPAAVRVLRAAGSSDDRRLVEALVDDFDVAELRAAERLAGQKSLRAALPTAGAAFRGIGSRERAIEWSDRIEAVRRAGRKKRGALAAALDAVGAGGADLAAEAAAADAVWDSVDDPPPFSVKATLLCDAVATVDAGDGATIRPVGCSDAEPVTLVFDDAPGGIVDNAAFAAAVSCAENALTADHLRVRGRSADAAAQWLWTSPASPRRAPAAGAVRFARALPDSPARVVAPQMTFSASRLNVFSQCARRFFYEYLCAAVEDRSTSNAVYGKVFHAALEALHRDVRVPSAWSRAEVLDKLCAELDASFGVSHHEFESELEYAVLRLRARQVAGHYVDWLFEESADQPLEVVEVEERHALVLGDHRFVGYIDRIDRPAGGGPVTILDYKTGRIHEDPEEYLRLVRAGEEAQLALYYAMRRARGDDVARVALVSIRDARDKTWVLALDIARDGGRSVVERRDRAGVMRATCSTSDLERSLEALTRRCDEITREGFEHFAVGDDPPCSYCSYVAACRERPADAERIFAR